MVPGSGLIERPREPVSYNVCILVAPQSMIKGSWRPRACTISRFLFGWQWLSVAPDTMELP